MKRVKRHNVKTEMPEASTSHSRQQKDPDLAHYIHDRVELMHQVFSVLKFKELKLMAPACIRNISLDDLQELCTEELLGISSKRLCAILDGAETPSDTESSSPSSPPEHLEIISLDSISSDDEILSQSSTKKKKHKHRCRNSKSKSKRKKSKDDDEGNADKSKASRAGLTVLELLELQARARAIRAQLQQEQQIKAVSESTVAEVPHSSDNEVEIKEEPAEVVEISSDEEKPKIEELQKKISQEAELPQQPPAITKRINDLVITVPQKPKQKIKLNRNKTTPVAPVETNNSVAITQSTNDKADSVATKDVAPNAHKDKTTEKPGHDKKSENRSGKSRKKKKHKKSVSKDDDDNDEITLQLSDTEKMDLLEDLDRKNYDCVSSDTSSDSSSEADVLKKDSNKTEESNLKEEEITPENSKDCLENTVKELPLPEKEMDTKANISDYDEIPVETSQKVVSNTKVEDSNEDASPKSSVKENIDKDELTDSETTVPEHSNSENTEATFDIIEINLDAERELEIVKETSISNERDSETTIKDTTTNDRTEIANENESQSKEIGRNLSEGELSDRESSEVEAVDLKPEVVCISDEENSNKNKKKKKKKDKKSKKEKKTKKKSDFRENGDQNFFKDNVEVIEDSSHEPIKNMEVSNCTQPDLFTSSESQIHKNIDVSSIEIIDKVDLTAVDNEHKTIDKENIDNKSFNEDQTIGSVVKRVTSPKSCANSISEDDIEEVYEILELSGDSSCCEVEFAILSKEPTALEIEALSAKIDEIDRVEVVTEQEIREYERMEEDRIENIENISWKDRYLDSNKVKKVMNTANILNALRKKNRDLKKKLAESKKENLELKEPIESEKKVEEEPNDLEEGSIEHYNTLQGSTTYIDPVKDLPGDLKKDAKLLLKMYKKLLKYNDMNKQVDKKGKKKKKKRRNKRDTAETQDTVVENRETILVHKDENEFTLDSKECSTTNKHCNIEDKGSVEETEYNFMNNENSLDVNLVNKEKDIENK